MQAVSFTSPVSPSSVPATPQSQSASGDGEGFGLVLRTLSEQTQDSGPEPDPAESILTDTLSAEAALGGTEGQAVLEGQVALEAPTLLPFDLPLTETPPAAKPPETDQTASAEVLSLLVSGAAAAARLPPAVFAISQGSEGAMTVLALAVPEASRAVTDADHAVRPFSGLPHALPDVIQVSDIAAAASAKPEQAQPQGVAKAAGDVPGPEPVAISVQTGPNSVPASGGPITAHIVLADQGAAAATVPQQMGYVPSVFAFRSADHPDTTELPEQEADHDAPASVSAPPAVARIAGPEPDLAAGAAALTDLPESTLPPFQAGDGEIAFGAPSPLTQGALPPPLQATSTAFVPAPLAATLSDLLSRRTDGPVELTLSPEELGRVRLSLSPDGDGLHVTVQVERIDTLDLLRRNSDLLLQEIRAQGFSGASFSFSGWAGNHPDPGAQPSADPFRAGMSSDIAVSASAAVSSPTTGLDLRL